PILDVIREELALQMCGDETTQHQKGARREQYPPSMLNRPPNDAIIKAVKTSLALFLQRRLPLRRRPLNVITEQRNERHCDDQGAKQRRRHNDGQTSQKLTGVAVEHQERKIGYDVRYSCEKNGCCQFGWTQPCRRTARQSFGKAALNPIARNDRD